jgi:haloalkane dehalogenase
MNPKISADFPFSSHHIQVKGSKMHYVDTGEGDPILFLHGQPTSSYLWRNIIPYLKSKGRCIAPDLIGMGKSDKPNLDYTYQDHYSYLSAFIEKLELKNITLVIHDWGSGLGFHYAHLHPENIKGIVFMESILRPMSWKNFPPDYRIVFKLLRTPYIGWFMLVVLNLFLNKVVPDNVIRKLSKEELDYYKSPFRSWRSRRPVRMWPTQIPIDGHPVYTHKIISEYAKWLTQTDIPKLCLYVRPGAIMTKQDIEYVRGKFNNTQLIEIGKGHHYLQEDHPEAIGKEIAKWLNSLT